MELWTINDLVVQFLGKLVLKKWESQVSTMEKYRQEDIAPEMAHLRVIPVLVNSVYKEEALLDSRSQIISISRLWLLLARLLGT